MEQVEGTTRGVRPHVFPTVLADQVCGHTSLAPHWMARSVAAHLPLHVCLDGVWSHFADLRVPWQSSHCLDVSHSALPPSRGQ